LKSTSNWHEYEIIATGAGEKLERWGGIFLLRPDPQVIWAPAFNLSKYDGLHGHYLRSATGGGKWKWLKRVPEEWTIKYNNLKFIISPTGFKHTGLFPEQAVNWERIVSALKSRSGATVLNLFGYTGGATVAAASVGAAVTHVDASQGMVGVCKRNCELNNIPNDRVRYIIDDCAKFVAREHRRGKTYDAIIMDPPSFGRGSNGEVWKIEDHLEPLVDACIKVLSDKPLFFLINSYTTGLQPGVMKNVMQRCLAKQKMCATIDAYEIGIPTRENIDLPCGCSCFADNIRR